MYLFAQLASYMFVTFLLGIAVGYALWRAWGEREVIAKYNAAEMRLAAHIARWEKTHQQETAARDTQWVSRPQQEFIAAQDATRRELHEFEAKHSAELHDFEVKQAALMREAEDVAIRKAEAAAEKKLADLARRLGDDFKSPGPTLNGRGLETIEAHDRKISDTVIDPTDPSVTGEFGEVVGRIGVGS